MVFTIPGTSVSFYISVWLRWYRRWVLLYSPVCGMVILCIKGFISKKIRHNRERTKFCQTDNIAICPKCEDEHKCHKVIEIEEQQEASFNMFKCLMIDCYSTVIIWEFSSHSVCTNSTNCPCGIDEYIFNEALAFQMINSYMFYFINDCHIFPSYVEKPLIMWKLWNC